MYDQGKDPVVQPGPPSPTGWSFNIGRERERERDFRKTRFLLKMPTNPEIDCSRRSRTQYTQ